MVTGPQNLIQVGAAELDKMANERKKIQEDERLRRAALESKKLAREEEEQANYEANKKSEEQKREIDQRFAAKKSLTNSFLPNMPQEGLMSKIDYQSQLTAEGMAGTIFAEFFVLAIKLLFNTDYMKQTAEYQQLKDAGMLDLVYEPNSAGNYPKVYRVDPTTGEMDYNNVVPNGEASHFEIRMNGLVPVPHWHEGLLAACDQYMGDMLGKGNLTAEQKMRAYGVLEAADNEMRNQHNIARDHQARQAMQPRPRPMKG